MANIYLEAIKRGVVKGVQDTPADFFAPLAAAGRLVSRMSSVFSSTKTADAERSVRPYARPQVRVTRSEASPVEHPHV